MRFVALTSLQAALLAAFTASVILALYFLRHKRERVVISSVLLWRRVLENRLENSIFEKLRRLLSILLALLTGLLVAMAIARPEIDLLTGTARRVVIVLDTSPSMQARTTDGKTRWQHAVDRAGAILDAGAANTQFSIVDTSDQLAQPFTTDRTQLRRAIDGLRPATNQPQFPDIDDAAEDVYFITDGVARFSIPNGTASMSVFEAAPNVGVTAFEIRSVPAEAPTYEAYLEVGNFGSATRSIEITVTGSGGQRITRTAQLAAGGSYSEALDVSQFDGGGIRAAVHSDDDAFSVDDVAYAYLPVKRRTKTLLVTRGNKLVETALRLNPLVELNVTDPDGYTANGDFDAFVFDDYAPADPPPRPTLILGLQAVSWLPKSLGIVEKPVIESIRDAHPVLSAVSLEDVSVRSAPKIDAANLVVLATAKENNPLMVASEQPRWVMLTFDLQDSDFPYHPAFPLFIDNAIAWFGRDRLALRRSPGIVDVPIPMALVRTLDGRQVYSQGRADGTSFEATDPGLYVASAGNYRQYIAVNFTDRLRSGLNNSGVKDGSGFENSPAHQPLLRRELWFYLLSAALLLIGAEWITYHRRITL
jgi:hypothetical protein